MSKELSEMVGCASTSNIKFRMKLVYLLYALALIIPFSQSIPLASFSGRNLHIGFDTIIIIAILSCFIVFRILNFSYNLYFDKPTKLLLTLWLWNFCMVVYTVIHSPGAPAGDAVMVFLRWSQYVPLFIVIVNMQLTVEQIRRVILICTFSLSIMTTLNFVEFYIIGIDYTVDRGSSMIMRSAFIEGAQVNYNISAVYMMIVLLLVTPVIIKNTNMSIFSKITFVVLQLIGIWLTSSRGALLALLVGFVFLGIFYYRKTFFCMLVALVPVSLISVVIYNLLPFNSHLMDNFFKLRYLYQAIPLLFGEDFQSLGLPEYVSGSLARFSMWGDAIRYFIESPIFGHGFRATRWSNGVSGYATADNYYLEMLSDTGVVGFFIFALFMYALFRSSVRLYGLVSKNTLLYKISIGYQAAFIGTMVVNLVGSFFMAQRVWGIFIVLSALVCNQVHVWSEEKKAHNFDISCGEER